MNPLERENAPPNPARVDGPLRRFARFTARNLRDRDHLQLERALVAYTDIHRTEEAVLNHLAQLARRWLPWCEVTVVPVGVRQPPSLDGLEPCFTLPAWNGDPHRVFTHAQVSRRLKVKRHQRRVTQMEWHLSRHLRALRDEAAPQPHDAWRRLRQAERRIETAGSVPQLKTAIARYARAACLADVAVVLVRRGDRLRRAAHVGHLHGHEALLTPEGLPFTGPLSAAWTGGQSVFRTGTHAAGDLPGLPGLEAYAVLPLRHDPHDTEALVLVLFDRHAHVWTAEERRRLRNSTKIAEIMLERLLLRRRNEALASMVGRLGNAEDTASMAQKLEASLRAFRPETGRLTVWWRDSDGYRPGHLDARMTEIGGTGGVTRSELASRYALHERSFDSETASVWERNGRRTVLLPLTFSGQTPAVAVLEERTHGSELDRGSLAVLEAHAQQAGLLILQRARGKAWHTLAWHDALTGLPNRLAFDQALAQAAKRATAAGTPLVFLLMDVNRFKRVNDELGHAAGDSLLKRMGPALDQALGTAGVLHRWAGDEFAALLPDASLDVADDASRRLKKAFAPLAPLSGMGLAVGAARFPDVAIDQLLVTADAALYADKASES